MSSLTRRRLLVGAGTALVLPFSTRFSAFAAPTTGFTHGVASGDPSQTGVTLWARYVGSVQETLKVEVADDPAFNSIVQQGDTSSSPIDDYCAHARVDGLKPGRWYHYRFVARTGETSPIGRTRTLPGRPVERFRIAVFSCSNSGSGWFNAYGHCAQRDDIDLAIHLGDYIYESPTNRADAQPGLNQSRGIEPPHELLALQDYRQRYASYRTDPDLSALHQRLPMIAVWDDHETANNSWRDGASGHDPSKEGAWTARKAAGVRAWREWLPMGAAWYDSYDIGDLATIFRIETRLLGRSKQLDDELSAVFSSGGDVDQRIKTFANGPLADPSRAMMDAAQEQWLADGLKASVRGDKRWQILAQQVIMGQTVFPTASAAWFAEGIPADAAQGLANRARLAQAGVPYSMDKWDGYPAARARLYASARAANANLVTITGDSHNAWAFDLGDAAGPVGVEFAGTSVSSFGMDRPFNGDAKKIAADFVAANPGLKWMDASQRGYLVLDITRDRIETEYVFVPALGGRKTDVAYRKAMVVEHGVRRLSV